MKKKMQQWAALCLALALAFCLGLPVWAEEPETYGITSEQKGKIILKWVEGDTEENSVTATAYQVIRVDYDYDGNVPKSPEFYWVDEVAGWVTGSYLSYITPADKSVPETFNDGSVNAEDMKNFAGDMAQAIRGGNEITGLTPAATVTGTGSITFSELEMGAYLILLEGGTKIYEPVFVSIVPTWDEKANTWVLKDLEKNVTAKSQALTLLKTVYDNQGQALEIVDYEDGGFDYAQVKIGDTVTYMLVADVPAYPADADNTGYQISDNLPEGMTLNENSVKVYGLDENAPNIAEGDAIDESGYTLTTDSAIRPVNENPSVTFNLNFTYNAIKNYAKIRVVYTATANEKLKTIGQDNNVDGNVNTAHLDYNNNPYGAGPTWETQTDTATVYSYGIMVQKVDKSNSNPLSGAEFTLKKRGESSAIQFVGSNGVYRVATAEERGESSPTLEVGASGDEKGKLVISGLDVDTYELTETKAPDGYIKLSAPVTITITDADPNGKVDDGSASADGSDGYVELTVENGKGFTLPSTGGMGTMLFTAIGTVLMGGGLVLLLLYLRRRNRQE